MIQEKNISQKANNNIDSSKKIVAYIGSASQCKPAIKQKM